MTSKEVRELTDSVNKLTELIAHITSDDKARRAFDRAIRKVRRTEAEYADALVADGMDPEEAVLKAHREASDGLRDYPVDPAADLERLAAKYHRRHFHIRSDQEGMLAQEDERRTTQDAAESYEEKIRREGERQLRKK